MHNQAMRLRHLEVFHAIMQTGSVSAAARAIHVSQPAITRALQQAEAELGFKLFQRLPGRLVATPEAHALHAETGQLHESLHELQQLTVNLRGRGRLRFAATPALAQAVLPRALARLLAQRPEAACELRTAHAEQMMRDLLTRDLDLGIAFEPPPSPGITQTTLGESELVVLAPQGAAARGMDLDGDSIGLAELARRAQALRLITLRPDDPLGRLLAAACEEADVELAARIEVQTYHIARALVEDGTGCAIVDGYTARGIDPARARVLRLTPAIRFEVKLLVNAHAPLPALARVMIAQLELALQQA
jgi:DNA-binding transcriptional LysR family regulator